MAIDPANLARWRLILGKSAEAPLQQMGGCVGQSILGGDQTELDEALEAIYSSDEIERNEWEAPTDGRPHGAVKGRTFPRVAKWLDQIRNFFPKDVVVLLQKDAIERRGLKQLLFEPEIMANIEPSLDLAATVLAMKNMVPEKAKSAARDLDNNQLQTIIPEQISFYSRQQRQNQWNIIIAMDQSGSMATSLIYGGIMGAILASIGAVETHVVAFNHEDVVDLTEHCSDPVDLLFGIQLGGAEDYWKATSYCERFMHTPAKTLYVLLGDLHDTSPNTKRFIKKMEFLLESGVKAIGLLAISDQGKPSYNESLADTLAKMGMPCFGCIPERLPELLAGVLRGSDLKVLAPKLGASNKA